MSDLTPLLRQWSLLKALAARRYGLTIREMAAETGVNARTIRRDLATLTQAGFPLKEETTDHGRKHWRIAAADSPPLSFTWEEAISIYLGRRLLEPLAGTHLWAGAQRAFLKIRATLGDQAIHYLEKMTAALHPTAVGRGDYHQQAETIDRLMIAIEDCRIAFLTYHSLSSTEPVTHDVYPYGLVWHRGSLYLVAHAPAHGQVRHYKVNRVQSVELDELKFNRPAEFDLERHLADSFGVWRGNGEPLRIAVRFHPSAARYVQESQWHPSQKLTPQPDGGLLAEFALSDIEEIKHWLLSFGRAAEVLQPDELREAMVEEVRDMLEVYREAELAIRT